MTHYRYAAASDLGRIPHLFAAAFADDPVWKAIVPNADARRRAITAETRWQLGDHHGHVVDVAVDGDDLLGAMIAEPPRAAPAVARTVLSIAVAALTALSVAGRRGRAHQRAVDRHRPDGAHWYFHDIATSPTARGRGIGSGLLRHRLDLVDQDPLPVFLEATTAASERLYARLGFATVDTVADLRGTDSRIMLRPATRRAA